jgi:hypothetical protein
MYHRVLKVGRWVVDFLFAERKYDIEGIVSCLRHAEAPRRIIDQAVDLMEEGSQNTGFTYTNARVFRAVVCIGPTTSGGEFQNTLVHEIHHLAVSIARELGVDLEGETPAYLAGDTMRAFADVVCKLGCR